MNAKIETKPLIAVITLTFKHEPWIKEALISVIDDPYPNLEIIVYDNGSPDRTAEIADDILKNSGRPYQIIKREVGISINSALNEAVRYSRAPFLIFLPGDDISVLGRLDKQIEKFIENPSLEILYGNGRNLTGEKATKRLHGERIKNAFDLGPQGVLYKILYKGGIFIQTAMMTRRLFEAVGGFDEKSIADDWILSIKIFQYLRHKSQYGYLDIDTFWYRRHEGGLHKQFIRHSHFVFELIEKYFPREIHRESFAEHYFLRAKVGYREHGRQFWFRATFYLIKSLWNKFILRRFAEGAMMAVSALLGIRIPRQYKWRLLSKKDR